METVKCNLCGSQNLKDVYSMPDRLYYPDQWFTVVECQDCGLGFVNPRPTFEQMSTYYPSSFYDYFERDKDFHQKRYANEYKIFKKFLENDHNGQKKLLDVGCANGGFPRYMKNLGWNVEAVEVSQNSKPISDFKVYNQEFPKIPVNDSSYDVITAWAVLEHTHDPMSYFVKASKLLKKGGLFVFLVTNFDSISSKYLFCEDLPRHLYFFTEDTISKYTSSVGLEIIKIDYSDKIYEMLPVNWLRYYLYPFLMGKNFKYEDIILSRAEYFQKYELSYNLSSNLKYVTYLSGYPLYMMDRVLLPLFTLFQKFTKTYGIVTYITRKI